MEQRRNQQKPSRQQASGRQAPRQAQQSQSGAGQQGDQSGQQRSQSGQQQQFDTSTRQQGGGSEGRLAEQIRPPQEVVDQSGAHVGTVDHVDGDRIKLTRGSSGDGEHHFVPLSQVAGIEAGKIRLRDRGDASFGMEAGR